MITRTKLAPGQRWSAQEVVIQEFEGRVAVVTGGGSGIGLALVRRFAEEGMKVVLGDFDGEALDAAVAVLTQEEH